MTSHSKSKKIIKLIFGVIFIGVLVFLVNKLYNPAIRNYLFLKKEQTKLLQQKSDMLKNKEVLKNQIQASKEEIGMEKSARSELNMKKEGEGVIFVSETTTTKIIMPNQSGFIWEKLKVWFSGIKF